MRVSAETFYMSHLICLPHEPSTSSTLSIVAHLSEHPNHGRKDGVFLHPEEPCPAPVAYTGGTGDTSDTGDTGGTGGRESVKQQCQSWRHTNIRSGTKERAVYTSVGLLYNSKKKNNFLLKIVIVSSKSHLQ